MKHIAPYLEHRIKISYKLPEWTKEQISEVVMISSKHNRAYVEDYNFVGWIENYKLILHPLSDLTKEIEVNGVKFIPFKKLIDGYPVGGEYEQLVLKSISSNGNYIMLTPYLAMKQLFEWHFDVFGLIENGLSVDINTLG